MHLEIEPHIVLAQMVPFLVLVFALKSWVFNPLLDYLEERHRRIQGFAREAKSFEADAEQGMAEVENRLARAKTEIGQSRAAIIQAAQIRERNLLAEARSTAELKLGEFRAELSETQKTASIALRSEVESLSREIASRVLGRTLQ